VSHIVAGVDGCPGGWIAIVGDPDDPGAAGVHVVSAFSAICDLPDAPATIAVDMPIGLPDRLEGPGRACEVAVRRLLGERQSSVFTTPARLAVMQEDYRRACEEAAARSTPPRKVSRQTFALFPRIREIDALLRSRPDLRARVFETHPEVCFAAMNADQPARLPKKIRGRPNPAGLAERLELLARAGLPPSLLERVRRLPARAAMDDFLDACACFWTAGRLARGIARCWPEEPPRDAFGLEMAIRA